MLFKLFKFSSRCDNGKQLQGIIVSVPKIIFLLHTISFQVRPLIEDEQLQSQDPSLYCDVEESSVIIGNDKQFQFDYVFDAEAGQVDGLH